jgi:hypothetical protein
MCRELLTYYPSYLVRCVWKIVWEGPRGEEFGSSLGFVDFAAEDCRSMILSGLYLPSDRKQFQRSSFQDKRHQIGLFRIQTKAQRYQESQRTILFSLIFYLP